MEKGTITKIAILAIAASLIILIVKPFILVLLLAAIVAYAFYPLHKLLKKKINNLPSSLIITSSVIFVLALAIQTGTNLALREIGSAYKLITSINITSSYLETLMRKILENLTSWFSHQIIAFPELVIGIIIFFIAMFYFLYDGERFYKSIDKLIPLKNKDKKDINLKIKKSINSFIYVQLVIGILQGIIAAIAFYMFGLKYILFAAIAAAILSILPMMGSFILYTGVALFFILTNQIWLGIGILVYGIGISGTLDLIIKPILFGKRTRIHPLITFIGIFGGLKALGLPGVILGPVILSISFTLIREFMKHYKNETV